MVIFWVFFLNSHSCSARWGCVWIQLSVSVCQKRVESNELHRVRIVFIDVLYITDILKFSLYSWTNALLESLPSYDRSLAWLFIFTFGEGTISCVFLPTFLYLGVFIFPSSGDVARQLHCSTETLCMTLIYALMKRNEPGIRSIFMLM